MRSKCEPLFREVTLLQQVEHVVYQNPSTEIIEKVRACPQHEEAGLWDTNCTWYPVSVGGGTHWVQHLTRMNLEY
jgi:hypothetical protein